MKTDKKRFEDIRDAQMMIGVAMVVFIVLFLL